MHMALNDGFDNSQKGKSLITRSVVCNLQDRSPVFYVDSVTDIVDYMYRDMLQKISYF